MQWYKHHLGDYDSHTSHLSWDEDLAYTRLLRAYYRREGPIPESETYRLTRASTQNQRAAVDVALREFFKKQEDGWHNKRADEEIAAYKAQAETNRRIATNRYTNRARSVHEASTNLSPNLEPRTENQKKPLENSRKGNGKDPRLCAFGDCTKPGSRSSSTTGGRFYCSEHFEGSSAPKHISEHIQTPANPPAEAKGKFDD